MRSFAEIAARLVRLIAVVVVLVTLVRQPGQTMALVAFLVAVNRLTR